MTAKKKLRKHPKPPTRSALARPIGSVCLAYRNAAIDECADLAWKLLTEWERTYKINARAGGVRESLLALKDPTPNDKLSTTAP
jgi:hypothetical protein